MSSKSDMKDADLAKLLERYPDEPFESLAAAINENGDYRAASKAIKAKRAKKDLSSWLKPSNAKRRRLDKPAMSSKPVKAEIAASTDARRSVHEALKAPREPAVPVASTSKASVLSLATPALVAKHSPCTLIQDVLKPDLAARLYLEMLEESSKWSRNKWHLFDREVESPHTTAFYVDPSAEISDEAVIYWYNGKQTETHIYTSAMQEASAVLQPLVNELVQKRSRMPLEYDGAWQPNVCAANCYRGSQESVGFHSDRLNYLGPYPSIASLTLGTTRNFRLRSVGPEARTFDIPLAHNSLIVMHAGCQEGFKHCVPPSRVVDLFRLPKSLQSDIDMPQEKDGTPKAFKERINLTYRFYRPDFQPFAPGSKYPDLPKCKCGQTCNLRPDLKHVGPDEERRFFWQCQSKDNCGYFAYLNMDSRGPCVSKSAS